MNDIIHMARAVDPVTALLLDRKAPQGMDHETFVWFLERFAALVRADEREQCAALADAQRSNTNVLLSYPTQSSAAYNIGIAIRARKES